MKSLFTRFAIITALIIGFACGTSRATVVYVDSAMAVSGAGTSWGAAYKTLQEALVVANVFNSAVTEIWIRKGTYFPTSYPIGSGSGGGSRDYAFALKNNLAIYGGFAGTETASSQRVAGNSTILSGDIGIVGDAGDNCYHVLISVNRNSSAKLDGVTVCGGNANSNNSFFDVYGYLVFRNAGGGMFNNNSSPTLSNCSFTSNNASSDGGGIYNLSSSSPAMSSCSFSTNTASAGGGMYNYSYCSPTLTNCSFSANNATSSGGGMFNYSSSSPILSNCILWGNIAASGPAIFNIASSAAVTYSDVQGGYGGTGNINADPFFVNAASPAGADGLFGTADDGLRLQYGSPAIDAGSNAAIPSGVTTDITGAARIQNTTVDMGAYEGAACPVSPTIYVDSSIAASGNGGSWTAAKKTLQEALVVANGCSSVTEIWIKKGTYYPTAYPIGSSGGSGNRDYAFALKNNLAIYGGFAGTETASSQRVAGNSTILSGDIGIVGDAGDNCYHVLISQSCNSSAKLDGVTVYGGNANNNANTNYIIVSGYIVYSKYGGGMYNNYSSPTLSNCSFSNNNASYDGGGMYNYSSSSPVMNNCSFSTNTASSGGGIFNYTSSPILGNCSFSANNATAAGGGILNFSSSSPILSNCILWGNIAASGPAIYNMSNSSPTVNYSDVQGGYAGTGNINADPLFVNAASPAGADGLFGTADDGLRLQYGSPAIDAGSNAAIPSGVTTDITGAARIQNTTVDMGAYEGAACPVSPTIYVDSNIAASGNGSSWAGAKKTLQEALVLAGSCSSVTEIWIKKGTYYPTALPTGTTTAVASTTARDYAFALKNNLAIYGGFAGTETASSQRVAGNTTILSGDIGMVGNSTDNCYHVILSVNCNNTAKLDGVTVSGGNANGIIYTTVSGNTVYRNLGGGIDNYSSSPTLSNCSFSANNSSANGGGMFNLYSSPALSNCSFSANSVTASGGGMYNSSSSPTLSNCSFSANTGNNGGGMYNSASSPNLSNCSFSANSATSYGGGMYDNSSSPALSNCIIWGNTATSGGLAIYNTNNSTPAVTYSDVQGGYTGTGNIDADPLFVNAAGPTGADGLFGTADDGLQLSYCSPAINTGSNAAVAANNLTDITGAARIAFTTVDMGAYEKQTATPANTATQAALSTSAANTVPFVKACDDGTWTYYAIPNNTDSIGFAIAWNGNTAARDAATVSITVGAANTTSTSATDGSWAMRRYWNVNLNGQTLSSPVQVRFYYSAADTAVMSQAAAASGLTSVSHVKWFKTVGSAYAPSQIAPNNINGGNFILLNPAASGTENNAAWVQFNGITSFSGGTAIINAGGSVALPVTLVAFSARKSVDGHSAMLSWKVAVEANLNGYEIQRSTDGKTFETIGTVPAAGSSDYTFTDNNPAAGINYYRLSMESFDGSYQYSYIRQLVFSGSGIVSVSPNPAASSLTITNGDETLNGTEAIIVDMSGRVVSRITLSASQTIRLSDWVAGVYLLRLANGEVVKIEKQ